MSELDKAIARELKERIARLAPLVFSRHEVENSPLRVSPIIKAITVEGVRI